MQYSFTVGLIPHKVHQAIRFATACTVPPFWAFLAAGQLSFHPVGGDILSLLLQIANESQTPGFSSSSQLCIQIGIVYQYCVLNRQNCNQFLYTISHRSKTAKLKF